MSTAYYQQRWEDAICDLLGCVQEQNLPLEENKNQKGITYKRTDLQWFQYYGQLYIRYLQVYRKLEDAYDQMVHPQKRIIMKQMLESVIVRLLQVKQNLIKYSTQTNIIQSDIIPIDQILSQLKLTPRALCVPIPKYFQDGKSERDKKYEKVMKQYLHNNFENDVQKIPEEIEEINDNITLDAGFETLVRIIQKIQRGRQGIVRGIQVMRMRNKPNNRERDNQVENQNQNQIVTVQRFWRAFACRRELAKKRQEELKFLGIQKEPSDMKIFQMAKEQREHLKLTQQNRCGKFQEQKVKLKQEIIKNEKKIIEARMQDQRRKWINKFLEMHEFSNLPNSLKQFYEDKQNQNKGPAQETAPKQEKKKDGKKQGGDDKGKSTKKNEVQKFLDEHISIGPTEAVVNMQKSIETYSTTWASRDNEQISEEVYYDAQLAKNQIRPQVEDELQKEVDALINIELDVMRVKYGIKKKKEKKPKKKKKKEKKVKIPQGLGKRQPEQLLQQLFQKNVAKVLSPANMSDFIGQHNNLNYLLEKTAEIQPDPSMAQVRNMVAEYIGIPLGSQQAKDKLQKWNWFLFYGPMGTGKTLLTRALQTETKAVLFDITPANIKQNFRQKSQLTKLIWSVIICAKYFQPAIVLVQDFETIFTGAGGKSKKKTTDPIAAFAPKLKKPIVDMKKNKLWTKNDRVAVIACSNKPYDASLKEMKKLFDKKIYFPYPNYSTRKLILKACIEKKVGPLPNFPYNTLAHTTQGFTAGSYIRCIDKVLTELRIGRIRDQPLKMSEFIFPLSNAVCVFSDQYEKFKKFTDQVTGLKQRREAKNAKKDEDKKDAKGAKKK